LWGTPTPAVTRPSGSRNEGTAWGVDDRFGGEVTLWWTIVRGNLEHEAHHRGQIAVYLRIVNDVKPERR
jgi:uncharacterized damage-inducible protein DinB